MLSQGEILTLSDNKKYTVVYNLEYNLKNYVYLIDQEDYTNTMFCEYDNNDGLEEVTDIDLLERLMLMFNEEMGQ